MSCLKCWVNSLGFSNTWSTEKCYYIFLGYLFIKIFVSLNKLYKSFFVKILVRKLRILYGSFYYFFISNYLRVIFYLLLVIIGILRFFIFIIYFFLVCIWFKIWLCRWLWGETMIHLIFFKFIFFLNYY